MLNIKRINKIRHRKIRSITKAVALKWKWAGHIARLQDQRWTIKVTEWRGPQWAKETKVDLPSDERTKLNA